MARAATRRLDLDERAPGPSKGHLARALSRLVHKKIALACIAALVIVYTGGIFAAQISPLVSDFGYSNSDFSAIRSAPSADHWLGTDRAGRDVLVRVLWAVQNTVVLTVVSMVTGGLLIGITLGLMAGYFGGRVDSVIMRVGELFSAFPGIFLLIILAATLKPRILEFVRWLEDSYSFLDGIVASGIVDYFVIFLSLVAFGWIGMARLVRAQILVLKETQHIEAARAIGASTKRILFVHLLPNAISPVVVTVTMGMGTMIGTEIVLSWLGLGIQPPRPSLGTMLLQGGHLSVLRNDPWLLLAPGAAAFLMVLSWNLLGDALNDVLNPRTR